jgi:hypothetical protein
VNLGFPAKEQMNHHWYNLMKMRDNRERKKVFVFMELNLIGNIINSL